MLKVAVLVSGGGTNLQALLDSEARGENPHGKISLVVASSPVEELCEYFGDLAAVATVRI